MRCGSCACDQEIGLRSALAQATPLQTWHAIAALAAFPLFRFTLQICPHAFMPSALTLQSFMWKLLSMQQIRLCLAVVASMVQSIVRQVQTLCMNVGCSGAARLAMQR